MKKSIFLAVLLAGFMMSCISDDIDNLTDIRIPIEVEEDFDVNLTGSTKSYSDVETFSLDGLGQITTDNLADLESVVIDKITYTVTNLDAGSGVTLNLSVEIFKADETSLLTASVQNVDLAAIEDKEQTLDVSQAQADAVADYLKGGGEIMIATEGSVSDTPVAFTLETKLIGTAVLDVVN